MSERASAAVAMQWASVSKRYEDAACPAEWCASTRRQSSPFSWARGSNARRRRRLSSSSPSIVVRRFRSSSFCTWQRASSSPWTASARQKRRSTTHSFPLRGLKVSVEHSSIIAIQWKQGSAQELVLVAAHCPPASIRSEPQVVTSHSLASLPRIGSARTARTVTELFLQSI